MISTDPAAGTQVRRDTAVRLVVSKGVAAGRSCPNFVGMTLAHAQQAASKNHLLLDTSAPGQYSTTVAAGLGRQPGDQGRRPRCRAAPRSRVVVSQGPPLVDVPDVFGMSKNEARGGSWRRPASRSTFASSCPARTLNQVYSQSPAGGTQARREHDQLGIV